MKALVALAVVLFTANVFAVNTNRVWHSGGETLKMVGKSTTFFNNTSKQEAIDTAFEFAEELQSGSPSTTVYRKFIIARNLWDSDEKCTTARGRAKGILIREMAKGNFKVSKVKVGSYINGEGIEVFTSNMVYYAPCIKKDRD